MRAHQQYFAIYAITAVSRLPVTTTTVLLYNEFHSSFNFIHETSFVLIPYNQQAAEYHPKNSPKLAFILVSDVRSFQAAILAIDYFSDCQKKKFHFNLGHGGRETFTSRKIFLNRCVARILNS